MASVHLSLFFLQNHQYFGNKVNGIASRSLNRSVTCRAAFCIHRVLQALKCIYIEPNNGFSWARRPVWRNAEWMFFLQNLKFPHFPHLILQHQQTIIYKSKILKKHLSPWVASQEASCLTL